MKTTMSTHHTKGYLLPARIASAGLAAVACGCTVPHIDYPKVSRYPDSSCRRIVKPAVAVTDFDNRAGFTGRWQLGSGMAELVVNELLRKGSVVVLERVHLGDILAEYAQQRKRFFRAEGRSASGRLKNAQYLIRGAVTDFTVSGDTSGWFGSPRASVRGRGTRARVTLLMHAIDIETGEIVASVKSEASASSGWFGAAVSYKGLSFGGETFFRTPLGRATAAAVRRGVARLLARLPRAYWQPMVAEGGPEQVIINGGANAGIRCGDEFRVRETGRMVTDPITGEIIENIPGRVVGKVRVVEVLPASAHARLISGYARRGFFLEPCKPERLAK